MCCTLYPAVLSKTILYAGEALIDGKLVHVLGYQNSAQNESSGPNAMILPFPASAHMSQQNVVDTSECKDVLTKYGEMFKQPPNNRRTLGDRSYGEDSVQVFDSGNYTVVLADNVNHIKGALKLVDEARRPEINADVFKRMGELYPDWPIAVCCFNSAEMVENEPMVWWYEPKNPNQLFAPALDAHDGGPPDPKAMVKVDHTVVIGSTINPVGVDAHHVGRLTGEVTKYLASKVQGKKYDNIYLPNGDFILDKSKLLTSKSHRITGGLNRVTPKAA